MPTKEYMATCKKCGRPTRHLMQVGSPLTNLVLSIVTLGVWVPFWILGSLLNEAPWGGQCTECGHTKSVLD